MNTKRKIKSIILLFSATLILGCQNKTERKNEILNTLEKVKKEKIFLGYYPEKNDAKLKLKGADYWINFKIENIEFIPKRNYYDNSISKRIFKEDKYSKGREIINYEMKIDVIVTNLNDRYLEFNTRDIRYDGPISGFNKSSMYDISNPKVKLDANQSKKITYSFMGTYDETMNDFYIGAFFTTDEDNNPKKLYFKLNYKSRKVIDKVFINKDMHLDVE